MMRTLKPYSRTRITFVLAMLNIWSAIGISQQIVRMDSISYKLYPQLNENRPNLPSPFLADDGREYIIATTKDNNYAIMDVTLGNNRDICRQLIVDVEDFPKLAETGLHSEEELARIKTITGRSPAEITAMGRPGQLSEDGFMRAEEDILSILRNDNEIVHRLGFTHPQLAKPLFHVLNMMDNDLKLKRWNMADHEWQNIPRFFYNGLRIDVEAHDTKGGQLSIFGDGIEGAFWIIIKRELSSVEKQFLKKHYSSLPSDDFDVLINKLTTIYTGEMEPQYIMRYGFYEGHSVWRTDPIAISFIFGLISLPDIESAFPNQLYRILTANFARDFALGLDHKN